jgi:dipeptidyl aminopeptidase/acylaminoacyl peptidase
MSHLRWSSVFLALVSCLGAKPFTIEQVLSAPFPSDLIASPDGRKVAWVMNERGTRNVWIAAAPEWKGARLTAYDSNDGIDISQLAWTSDGSAVVYVRGGDFEFPERPGPNPRSDPAGISQEIWIAAPGSAPRRIAEGNSPAVSPKGDGIAYLSGGQIWWAPLAGEDKPLQLVKAKGKAGDLRWSPDGAKLAFVSSRNTHSFIGVYDFAAKSIAYLDPGVDRDFSPVWSPDGKQVVFVRIPAAHQIPFVPQRSAAEPWSIRVAPVAGGEGRQVWKSETGRGSAFHGLAARSQLLWGAGDRIIFPWERDGWLHLYAIALEGGHAAALTPGAFEVENAEITADRSAVLFSSNQEDIDRRHIWRVPVASGTPAPVTSGEGIEWSPVPAGGDIVFLHSDPRRPARVAVRSGSSARDVAPDAIPSGFPDSSLVVPQAVVFNAADGMPIHGQLFLPPSSRAGEKHRALIFLHGGSRRQMLLGWHYMFYYSNAYAMNQYLANQGYIVLAINYRSGIGYGLDFREALNYGAAGASEFDDVQGAGLYLRGRSDVDSSRVGLWGGSYGGYLTALGLARASNLFAAGVDFHGVHDWNVVIKNFDDFYDAQKAQDAARLAFASSPMASVNTWKSPVLLIHGDDDRNVPFSETVTLVEALRKQGVYFEQLVFPDEIHDFLTHAAWVRAYTATADFFRRKLQASSNNN